MKKIGLTLILFLCLGIGAQAQKIVIGEKAPEIKVREWHANLRPELPGKPYLISFFISNSVCGDLLPQLDRLAGVFKNQVNLLVIHKEPKEKAGALFDGKKFTLFAGYDDNGRTFTTYNVKFIPYSVLVDAKGKVAWMGNPTGLTEEMVRKFLN